MVLKVDMYISLKMNVFLCLPGYSVLWKEITWKLNASRWNMLMALRGMFNVLSFPVLSLQLLEEVLLR